MTGQDEVKTEPSSAADMTSVADRAIFKLSKPIQAMGKQVSELSLRAPVGADFVVITEKQNRRQGELPSAIRRPPGRRSSVRRAVLSGIFN